MDIDSTERSNISEQPIVVFQCKKCLHSFGDSLSWIDSSVELEAFLLKSVAEGAIIKSDLLRTSAAGNDFGSAYFDLICSNCNDILGRWYRTTPKQFDGIRETYTFFMNSVNNYIFGEENGNNSTNDINDQDLDILKPNADDMSIRLSQLETMICACHNEMVQISDFLIKLSKGLSENLSNEISNQFDKLNNGQFLKLKNEVDELKKIALNKNQSLSSLPQIPTSHTIASGMPSNTPSIPANKPPFKHNSTMPPRSSPSQSINPRVVVVTSQQYQSSPVMSSAPTGYYSQNVQLPPTQMPGSGPMNSNSQFANQNQTNGQMGLFYSQPGPEK